MATINEELTYLEETKQQIKQAIIDKGQEISENDSFRSFVQKINNIETDLNTNRVPIWFMYVNHSESCTLEELLENKPALPFDIHRSRKHSDLFRVDDFDDIVREEPQVGDYVYASSVRLIKESHSSSEALYFAFGQVDYVAHTDEFISGTFVTIDAILNDNFVNALNLSSDIIKAGETILGVTGTYAGATMKSYNSETAMNNDIANIQEGEVVKVVVTSGTAGDVDNPLTTTTTYYIKETTMKKLVKEEDTISHQEYSENVDLANDILGEEESE